MKLWELASAFRQHRVVVRSVLAQERWRVPYLERFDRYETLVSSQDRSSLDEILPEALTREIAAQIPDRYLYDVNAGTLRKALAESSEHEEVLTSLEVHDRFGGAAIEEVSEYGSAEIPRSNR